MPMRVSPSQPGRPGAASRSATTRVTMAPTVRHETRSNAATVVLAHRVASHATVWSNP